MKIRLLTFVVLSAALMSVLGHAQDASGRTGARPERSTDSPADAQPLQVNDAPTADVAPAAVLAYRAYMPLALNSVPSATPTATATRQWVTIMHEDFEGDFPGPWRVLDSNGPTYDQYRWGVSRCRAYDGTRSAWAVGSGTRGGLLQCGDPYPNGANSWMIYGPFSLARASAATLTVQLWLQTEAGADAFCRMASLDGKEFHGLCDSGVSGGWLARTLDLAKAPIFGNLIGQQRVWIALIFVSGRALSYPEGAYVDDVTLSYCTGAPCLQSPQSAGRPGIQEYTATYVAP